MKEDKAMYKIGFVLMIIGIIFAVTETIYFGSNWLPESREEFICDYIACAIVHSGIALMFYAMTNSTITQIKEILKGKQ